MGVKRDATDQEIKRAYRKLAREFHPDVSQASDAEARFKEVGEAYAVLKDPEKRAAYDQLGEHWESGQDFQPPPDWSAGFEFGGRGFGDADGGGYSDFFSALFGQGFRPTESGRRYADFQARGEDHHAKVMIDLKDAFEGATRSITLRSPTIDEHGHLINRQHTLSVKIPKGVTSGQRIRLPGQGGPGVGTGTARRLVSASPVQSP